MSMGMQGYALTWPTPVAWSGQARLSSREVQPGDLFAALPGQNHDGHKFVGDALMRGAAVLLCAEGTSERLRNGVLPWPADAALADVPQALRESDLHRGMWLVEVSNVELALQDLAHIRRCAYAGTVIGVTGSYGKTTTKEILRQLLPGAQATQGNLNNHLGVPVSLLNFDMRAPQWICEMGMNHPGELTRLGNIAQPQLVIFTPLGRAHIGEASGEWIAQAKTELLRTAEPPRAVWFPRNSQAYSEHLGAYAGQVHWYGVESDDPAWRVTGLREDFPDGATLEIAHGKGRFRASWDVPFAEYAGSVLVGLMLRGELGLEPANVDIALRAHMGNRMRMAEPAPRQWIVNDAYNASPETMAAAARWCGRRQDEGYGVTALLADMFELGIHSADLHREVLQAWRSAGVSFRLAARSTDFRAAATALGFTDVPALPELPSWHELVRFARPSERGQIVFAKGSNGSGLGRQLDALLPSKAGAAHA